MPQGNPGGHRAGSEDRGLGLHLCHHHIRGSEPEWCISKSGGGGRVGEQEEAAAKLS